VVRVGPVGTRVTSKRYIARLALAGLAVASTAVLVSGCSSNSGFPAVHDMPAARTETTLTPDQIKQATDDLISERDRTEAQAQATGQLVAATNVPTTTGSVAKKSAASSQQAAQPSVFGVSAR
jgi:hypothetical protein